MGQAIGKQIIMRNFVSHEVYAPIASPLALQSACGRISPRQHCNEIEFTRDTAPQS